MIYVARLKVISLSTMYGPISVRTYCKPWMDSVISYCLFMGTSGACNGSHLWPIISHLRDFPTSSKALAKKNIERNDRVGFMH